MVSDIEYALMAGVAYRSTRDQVNRFPLPGVWAEVPSSYKILPSGFEAVSFQRDKEIVISFAGTNPSSIIDPDWIANLDLATGLVCAQQLKEAADYYLAVKKDNPGVTISFTGHSLGGGLAALMGVFFDEKAVTFDQAPFANSAKESFGDDLEAYLLSLKGADQQPLYSPESFGKLSSFTDSDLATRTGNVSGFYVKGEVLSTTSAFKAFPRIGTLQELSQGAAPDNLAFQISLHSQALLTAFLQDSDFLQVTDKLPDMVKMLFDELLFAHDPSKLVDPNDPNDPNGPKLNFLEGLVQDEARSTPEKESILDRFTSDLQLIAQDGGLTMNSNLDKAPTAISHALIAFAMQAYYDNRLVAGETLFESVEGGIRFNRYNVSDTLAGEKDGAMVDRKSVV